jgi:cellulose synthase/poly-beta-1,6-N-acetylglucosamine synthase-like glycosyltransferase
MISILITAYKEAGTIGKAIEHLTKNVKEGYEVIVAAPDKGTLNAAKKYKVKLVKDPAKGKPAAMNLLLKKAKGDILIFSDGDVYVNDNAVNELLNKFKDEKVGAVTGRPVSLSPRNTMLGYWSHLLTDIGAHETRSLRVKKNKFILCSGYLFAIRNVINKIPEDVLSEDAIISHFIWKKGYKIDYAPKAEVYIRYPTTFRDWMIQKRRSTGGYNQINKYIKKPERMRSMFREAFFSYRAWSYPKSLKEVFYTFMLYFAKFYLWIKIYIDLNIRKKPLKEVWKRVETTK